MSQSMTEPNSGERRLGLLAFVGLLVLLAGCGVVGGGDSVAESERVEGDTELFRALQDDWPVDPSMYELKDVVCTTEAERVVLTATIVNKAGFQWSFSPRFSVQTTDGETLSKRSEPGLWEIDQEAEVSTWWGGTDFDDPPNCDIQVLHSNFLALQDDEFLEKVYEVLDWNP